VCQNHGNCLQHFEDISKICEPSFYMQTVVISIVTCDVCIRPTDLHASAESWVKVSTVGENISHDAS